MKSVRYNLYAVAMVLLALLGGCNGEKKETAENQESRNTADAADKAKAPAANRKKTILFFGNSLTAGYGVEPSQAFPALVGRKAEAAGLTYQVINAGLSGETTAGGKSRISWVLRQPVDVFVLELGANDGLRGIPLDATRRNLQAIMDTVRKKSPQAQIILAGMQIPPNLGADYTREFRELFKDLADENDVELIPFLLEGVGGIPRLNQSDGIHPTPEGHRILADNVWEILEPVLRKQQGTDS
ncbi:arylesterase [Larkinella soli]|uniref:arylesterase n=1 Tax=Larkinella soli TaxID=1770527 RepID=UPI000FFC3C56|nr:arylesterase [Larkinella soli]